MNEYFKGQKIRCSVAFTVNAVATDPTTITFKYRKPDGTTTTHLYGGVGSIVVKDTTGAYHADVSTTMDGEWLVRWEGTTACEATVEDSFLVTTRFG